MAKVSIKSSGFKSFKPVKVSKPAPTVSKPKTITAQKPTTVGKPVDTKPKTVSAPVSEKTTAKPQVVEKQIISREISKPQYIYSGGSSNGFGDMLSNYIVLDWMFGSRNNSPTPAPAAQTTPAAQSPASTSTTAAAVQPTDNSIVEGNSSNSFFPFLTCLSIAIIATLIPFAVYRYFKNKQDEAKLEHPEATDVSVGKTNF